MRPTQLPPPDGLRDLTDAEAADFIEGHPLALVAFLDAGDDACQRLRVRLQLLAARVPQAAMGAVDVARHALVADALGVKSVPFLVVFQQGEVVDRLIGAPPDAVLMDVLRARVPR